MQIAKVRGTIVSTQKLPGITGIKLLLVQFINEEGQLLPKYEVVADSVGAGLDEWVLVSRRALAPGSDNDGRPVDAMIIGIIDTITLENRRIYDKKDEYR